jgi:hypothetical protein
MHTTATDTPAILDWRVLDQRFFSFEVALGAITSLVPDLLELVELRPGVGLVSVGWLRFAAGQFGPDSPEFDEVFCAIHVHPDLSVRMPAPRTAFLVHRMCSNSEDLIRVDQELIAAPATWDPSLRVTVADGGAHVHGCSDAGPIFDFRVTAVGAFEPASFWGQHFTARDVAAPGGLRCGAWQWQGVRADQMEPRNASRLHPHPLFGALDVRAASRPYRQMTKGPGVAAERFFPMTLL